MRWLSRSQKYSAPSGPKSEAVGVIDLLIRIAADAGADKR